jgi:hypothetical protein
MPVFKDANQLYDTFGALFTQLTNNPKVGPLIAKSGLIVRFKYSEPDSEITIDATKEPIEVFYGTCALKPIVDMSMSADTAHQFWLGKLNLVSALTRGTIVAKGPIPSIMKLLPIISPAFKIYPEVLKAKGFQSNIQS